jgi:hypothetical protein
MKPRVQRLLPIVRGHPQCEDLVFGKKDRSSVGPLPELRMIQVLASLIARIFPA